MKLYEYHLVRSVLREDAPLCCIRNTGQVYDYAMKHCYRDEDMWRESVWAIYVNRKNEIIGQYEVSKGGTAMAAIDKKIICKVALEMMAEAVVLVHNHPSGDSRPSQADIEQTRQVKQALGLLDMQLLDHIIIGDDEYYSFGEEQVNKA